MNNFFNAEETLGFENDKIKTLYLDVVKSIKMDMSKYSINFNTEALLPMDGLVTNQFLESIVSLYNNFQTDGTKTVLVPLYNIPLV